MLTWLLPRLFSTSGRLAAILASWWHSRSTGDEYSVCLIKDQSWINCIDITSRWDTFVSSHLYGNKGVSLPLWPIRRRWFHTYSPCAEPLGDGHEGMWARFGSQGSIALNWHSRYSGTRYSGTWLCVTRPQWVNGALETLQFCVKPSELFCSCNLQTFFLDPDLQNIFNTYNISLMSNSKNVIVFIPAWTTQNLFGST